MGECCAQLTYGVLISEEDYRKLYDELYEEKEVGEGRHRYKGHYEKDDESLVCIEQPYETETYMVTIRKSGDYTNDGATPVKTDIDPGWNELLKTFLQTHNVQSETEPSWLLVGHYG